MATLTVNGRRVKVDDGFLKLTPEQQEATVNEIAASFATPGEPAAPSPSHSDALATASGNSLSGKVDDLPSQRPSFADEAMSFGRGMIEGLPVVGPTLMDWRRGLDANVSTMLHGGDAEALKERYAAEDEALKAKTGGARLAGGITGNVLTLAALGGTAAGGRLLGMTGSVPMRIGMGAASGAALSGADTLARGGTGEDAVSSALVGGALGGVLPSVGAFVGKTAKALANRKAVSAAIKDAPDSAALKETASALFESSRAAMAGVRGDVFSGFAARLIQKAQAAEMDDVLDGEAMAAYRKLAGMAMDGMEKGGVSLARLHNMRQIAQDVAVDATKDRTKRFAGLIVDGLDDLIENLDPRQMVGQGGRAAADDLAEGISTWARAKKLAIIEEAMRKADLQKSGLENGLRLQFLAILRDPKKAKLFSDVERAEIEKVGKGTTVNNLLNLVGKFGFGFGNSSTNALGGAIGAMTGGIPGVLAASGARKVSEVLTRRAAERAAKVAATPGIDLPAAGPAGPALVAPASLPLEVTRKRRPIEIEVRGGAR